MDGREEFTILLIRQETHPGVVHRLQYKTDLRQANWTDWRFAMQASEDEPALWDLNLRVDPPKNTFASPLSRDVHIG
jgi:hypothetical protein